MVQMLKCRQCGKNTRLGPAECEHCAAPLRGSQWVEVAVDPSTFYGPPDAGQASPAQFPIGREGAIVLSIAGLICFVIGVLRWNSIGWQIARGFGQTDGVGMLLLLGGAVGLIVGGYALFASPSAPRSLVSATAPRPPATNAASVEDRIRQLDDLRSKNLITEAQHEQRKQEIISSL